MMKTISTSLLLVVLSPVARSFTPASFGNHGSITQGFRHSASVSLWSSLSSVEKEELLETIRSMRVKELKSELEERRISTADAFEKEELVKRLYNAKLSAPKATTTKATATKSTYASDNNIVRGDISYVTMESGKSVFGTYNSESIRITDVDGQPYPTMTIDVVDGSSTFPLKLLLDTACSGLVLTPSAVSKHNMRSTSIPGTMTGAGGSAALMSTTQIDRFRFGYDITQTFGPLLAAVQDTGALDPLGLDGILGLSFMGQYACNEIDIDRSQVAFYKNEYRPPYDANELEIVAEGELSPTRLGIWTVDTIIDVGQPSQSKSIKMLLDTGATSTILNWKGLGKGLGLSRASPEVKQLTQETGVIGSDNVAMSLSHRIEVERPIQFGRTRQSQQYDGMTIDSGKPVAIDIGDIAILDQQLAADNVCGILGMNVFAECSMMRMSFSGPVPRMTLFQKKKNNKSNSTNSSSSTSSVRSDDDNGNESKSKPTTDDSEPTPATTTPSPTMGVENAREENQSPATPAASATEEETTPRKKKKKRRYE